ncbi:MAG TPA: hydrogenase maturation protease [Acidobacteriaceae bacterium]
MTPSILIAGVGNIFLGDDAFGVEVVRALGTRQLPDGVAVADYGIRGFDLAYALLDPWDAVVIVDALPRGGAPGTLYTIEPDLESLRDAPPGETMINPHGMDPVRVLQLAFSMGTVRAHVTVVGCEPKDFGDELEGRMGLSAVVQSSIPGAVEMVESVIRRILAESGVCPV